MNNNLDIRISKKYIEYLEAIKFMEKRVKNISNDIDNELLWFLNHNHIYTCGTSSKNNEILKKKCIPIIKTNRGGKTTYHGPGQRIVYLMINLNKRKKDIKKFVRLIEFSIIELLKGLGIEACTYPGRVGVWVTKTKKYNFKKEKKIAAIGLRIKKWVTYHGLSFNINPDLKYYKNIHACGLKNYSSTSLSELKIDISTKEFDETFKKIFIKNLIEF